MRCIHCKKEVNNLQDSIFHKCIDENGIERKPYVYKGQLTYKEFQEAIDALYKEEINEPDKTKRRILNYE